MKRLLSICLSVVLGLPLFLQTDDALAKNKRVNRWIQSPTGHVLSMDRPMETGPPPRASAVDDTTWLCEYSFDTPLWFPTEEGWVSHDLTEQLGTFFHVAGIPELDGGSFGGLVPLEGYQSLWCGVYFDPAFCAYATLPGYGDNWNQSFVSRFFEGPSIQLSYKIRWDTETAFDFVYTQYDSGDGNWVNLPVNGGAGYYDGTGTTVESMFVTPTTATARFRFLFTSDGAYSDADGDYNSDGAVLIDSITVVDQYGPSYEDFEDEVPGDLQTQDWSAEVPQGYGDFAGLFLGYYLPQNQCNRSLNNVWGFFSGSTYTYSLGCGGNGVQPAVPMMNARNQYIANEIWSPGIPLTGSGGRLMVQFDVYKDLPLDNLVFGQARVRSWEEDCPGQWGQWRDVGSLIYGDEKDWVTLTMEFGALIEPAADSIQVAIGVTDLCSAWCGALGSGACHTHAPLVDNVRIMRIDQEGPQWTVRDIDLFQDTFPTDGTATGTGKADAADDTTPPGVAGITPRDEVLASCASLAAPIRTDPHTGVGPAVYCYVSLLPPGQPGKTGADIEGDPVKWPFVATVFSLDGKAWYQYRMDTWVGPPEADYCIDLNDDLFTPGDTILFFFGAEDELAFWTYWSEFTGTTDDFEVAATQPMEFQILPGGGWLRGGTILYVDDFDGRGAQPYFDTAFEDMEIDDLVDRYDVRAPSSMEGNALGGRVVATVPQLVDCYDVIIWNSGDLSAGTIGDGTGAIIGGGPEKGDDFQVLYDFLNLHPGYPGVYISGDDVAEEWVTLGPSALALRTVFMSFLLTKGGDHRVAGFPVNPLVVGEPGSMFDYLWPDTLIAFGGCPALNDFDVLEPTGTATLEATYEGTGIGSDGAVIAQTTTNSVLGQARVVLSGFSYHYIRDDRAKRPIDRSDHLYDILTYLNQIVPPPLIPEPRERRVNRLYQNFQNPFNPETTIRYSIAERARVSLRIYNVAGQLVRTLVDEVQDASDIHEEHWYGLNNEGRPVASGVYFYKLVTKNFSDTKKMVLIK